jgi:2-amino-4-hydroxy-6-hydroxymethyldihydropteridine diphosphokinase
MGPSLNNAYISIGSNLGDKLLNCRNAMAALESSGAGKILARSRFYATEPVDYADQDWFINAAVKIATPLSPHALLKRLIAIQRAAGRKVDTVRFGPRILDLDIIFYADRVIEDRELQIPHPRMHKRRFVLQPVCDIDPRIVHPLLHQNVQGLLDQLGEEGQRVCLYPCAF